MGLNITHTINNFQFENKENLRNTARDILNNKGASNASVEKIINSAIFDTAKSQLSNIYAPQLAIIKASSQISMNTPLKETLKYLKNSTNKKALKKAKLGEFWELFNNTAQEEYEGELIDLIINPNKDNIFAAA